MNSSKVTKLLKRLSRLNTSILFLLESRQDFNESGDEKLIFCLNEKTKYKQQLETQLKKFNHDSR